MQLRKLLALVPVLGLGVLPGPAPAQQLQVVPVQIELTRAAPNEILTLHNRGSDPMRFQVSAFEWHEGAKGEMQLSRTKDVTFFPSLLTIAPGQKRNVRVAAAAPFESVEKTYRIVVEQLPGAPGAPQTSVRVLTRLSIPVYLEPPEPSRTAELSSIALAGRKISVVMRNTGNVRFRPELKVVGKDVKGEVVFEKPLSGWYVLAGGDRTLEMEAPRDGCERVRTLSAEVQVEKTALQTQVPVAGGACGP